MSQYEKDLEAAYKEGGWRSCWPAAWPRQAEEDRPSKEAELEWFLEGGLFWYRWK